MRFGSYRLVGRSQSGRRPRVRIVTRLVLCALWVAPVCAEVPLPGDPRAGYEDRDFESASRRLASTGQVVDGEPTGSQLGLPPLPGGADDPALRGKIALGRQLFFDRRLSFNGTLSCGMCHVPEQGFTQHELRTPVGFQGHSLPRNAPTLLNVAYRPALFVDGRESTLENQVWSPLLAADEMANPSIGSVLDRVSAMGDYAGRFRTAFGRGVTMETLGAALASYERTLVAAASPFDRFYFGGDPNALDDKAKHGFALFLKNGCSSCHRIDTTYAQFTDDAYHDTGIGYQQTMGSGGPVRSMPVAPGVVLRLAGQPSVPRVADLGRYLITGDPVDRYRFRTPSLRNVAVTAPYMHDGSIATLAEVIDYYADGGVPHEGQDPRIRRLALTPTQRDEVAAFLNSLTGENVNRLARDARSAPIGD
jgi:cytochrome c peroxidase